MEKDQRQRLKAEGQGLDATVHIGKGGLTDGVVEELELVRGAIGDDRQVKDAQAQELAERLVAELVERRGHTVLLYRRRKARRLPTSDRPDTR